MKTTLRNSFHSMSIQCRFPNQAKSRITLQLGYDGVGGSGKGVTQAAFDSAINAFDKVRVNAIKRYKNNGEMMTALNEFLLGAGIGDPLTLGEKLEEFAAA